MEEKKIIAICQSGGAFVASKDGTLTYNGGDAYAIDIDKTTQLKDFKQEVSEMFNCSSTSIRIKYFLPGNKKTLITISKDKDLERMISFIGDSVSADVFILSEEGGGATRNVSHMPASRSSRTTLSETIYVPADPINVSVDKDNQHVNDYMDMDAINETPLDCVPGCSSDENHHKAAQQWENTITGVDQRFNSFTEFREGLHKFSIAHGFAYRYKKNDSHRVTVKCKSQGCLWRIYASKLSTTQLICIKKMHKEHTCERAAVKAGYRATKGWVGNIIKEKLKVSPNYKPKDIADDIKREYGIHLNYSQAWRAKEIAREQLQGSYTEAYSQLPYFCEKIKETNPGSFATFSTKEDSSFHRLFISFHASICGFQQGCRPLLFLDSYPLNSKYQGVLLAATAPDGDDDVFPVSFAIVDVATDENWHWFLLELRNALSTMEKITFVADFQKGLKNSLHEIFGGYHSYCLRYVTEKLNKDLKGRFSHEARRFMINDFHAAACAPKLEAFDRCTENIKGISPEAYKWVIDSEPKHWANAFFEGARYNHMASNFGQTFYNWVSESHDLPITQMVDVLRRKMMESIYAHRIESTAWNTVLTPSNEEKLQKAMLMARSLQVMLLPSNKFGVSGENEDTVDVDHWDCSCRNWQLTGLPCCHAIAVFECIGRNPYEFCSRYLTVEKYRLTYLESIQPVPSVDRSVQDEPDAVLHIVTPPPTKRPPGRPKMKQADSIDTIKRQLQCSKCKGLGHNKKTCKDM